MHVTSRTLHSDVPIDKMMPSENWDPESLNYFDKPTGTRIAITRLNFACSSDTCLW